MNEILKNTIKVKHSRLAMFIAYIGRELKDEHVRGYADFYGFKTQSHQSLENAGRSDFCTGRFPSDKVCFPTGIVLRYGCLYA